MYLHLGNDVIIKKEGIIGVYDMDRTTVSKRTRDFLSAFEKKGRLVYVTNDLPKSFIVYSDKNGLCVYVSQVSTTTLLRRSDFLNKPSKTQQGEQNV